MKKSIKVGGQFSGVGAFDQALKRLNIPHENVYQAEWDKYARQTYLHNYQEPFIYTKDVNDTPIELINEKYGSLDLVMFSPPCQAFSLAGKRLGKADKRGILFFNSHEFIQENKPRFFIFENVKGLLSDSGGKTFSEWINMLGGKSVNGNPVLFPYEDSVPYHIYWKVLNSKDFNIPQNRERVFIIGIRDDQDNRFTWPMELPLKKILKDVLEPVVDKKYFLSEKMIKWLLNHSDKKQQEKCGFKFSLKDGEGISNAINSRCFKMGIDDNYIQVKSATKQGFEIATDGDSINFSQINSETRRGRVGKGVAQTLETSCNQGVMVCKEVRTEKAKLDRKKTGTNSFRGKQIEFRHQEYSNTIGTSLIVDNYIKKDFQIRKLTVRECFRLMDFDDTFTWPVSDSQAYKQAGNSICVGVLTAIISKLKL